LFISVLILDGVLLFFALLLSLQLWASSNRVEELFIWKISEVLKLSVKEEKELAQLIRELNVKKAQASQEVDAILQKMTAQPEKDILKKYRSALIAYNDISLVELERVKKILGETKAVKYLAAKSELSQKIRSILANPEKASEQLEETVDKKQPLPEPKLIIEE
jgi:hypothetical protein